MDTRSEDARWALADQFGLAGAGTRVPDDNSSEWVFDLYWWDKRDHSLVLAMESEWDPDRNGQFKDFDKLMICRAKLRLFVFQGKDTETIQGAFQEFRQHIQKCAMTIPGDRYLLAGFAWAERQFKFLFDGYIHQ